MGFAKYFVPNGFTAASMLFGFASVLLSSRGEFELAAWMITWGVLLDKLDGTFARLLNASSDFGVQFDSFADFVIFGIAPAALIYFLTLDHLPYWVCFSSAGFYVVMTACRLARFNITDLPGSDRVFFGLPTTLSGAIVSTSYLAWMKYYGSLSESALTALPIFICVMGALMVSPFILPKLKMRGNLPIDAFQVINVSLAYIIAPLRIFPEYLLFLSLLYVIVGFIAGVIKGVGDHE